MASKEPIPGRCGARVSKHNPGYPGYCEDWPRKGKERCHKHGGSSPGGKIKHGRHVAALEQIPKLMRRYAEALADPKILDLRPTLAMLDARIDELLEQFGEHDGPDFRESAVALLDEIARAKEEGRWQDAGEAMSALDEHLRRGAEAGRTWHQVLKVMDRRSFRAERALEIELKAKHAISARELTYVLSRILDLIVELCREAEQMALGRDLVERIAAEVMGSDRPGSIDFPRN